MIKKLVALVATALLSLNASAGYVQYDFHYGSPDRGLEGFIIQHDTDHSIALFSFQLNDPSFDFDRFGTYFYPQDSEGYVLLDGASTYFRNGGPTNFHITDSFGADHLTTLDVKFSRNAEGTFSYTAHYFADLYENQPPETFSGTLFGLATLGTVDPWVASYLDEHDGYEYGVPRIVPRFIGPNEIPEPTSIALLAVGAAGLASSWRRRKSLS